MPRVTLTDETTALWTQIITVAEAIHALSPWKWIEASSVLGVEDPASRETDWCSVMGQGGETFGVALYPGDDGVVSLHQLYQDEPDEFDAIVQQTAWVLTFNDRDMVAPDMAAILKQIDRRYRGANAWPEILQCFPGFLPIPPTDPTALRRILHALERVHDMCVIAHQKPQWDAGDEQGRSWVAVDGPDGVLQIIPRHLPTVAPKRLPQPYRDEVAEARILAAKKSPAGTWILDWFPTNNVIDGPETAGRPYYIIHPLLADARTGMILGTEVSNLSAIHANVVKLLLSSCAQHGRPAQVLVRRDEAIALLAPLTERLGISLVQDDRVGEFSRRFRDTLKSFGGRGR